ncbi:MAG: DUF6496 domain-containing protein [Gemmatimonadaceae bacterium]
MRSSDVIVANAEESAAGRSALGAHAMTTHTARKRDRLYIGTRSGELGTHYEAHVACPVRNRSCTMPAKKRGRRKYGAAASKSVESAMRRRKRGTLKIGKGGKGGRVKSRKQAIAIGLAEGREKGAKVPPPKGGRGRTRRKK